MYNESNNKLCTKRCRPSILTFKTQLRNLYFFNFVKLCYKKFSGHQALMENYKRSETAETGIIFNGQIISEKK